MAGVLGNNKKLKDNSMKNDSISSGRASWPEGWLVCNLLHIPFPESCPLSQPLCTGDMSCISTARQTSRWIDPVLCPEKLDGRLYKSVRQPGKAGMAMLAHVSGAKRGAPRGKYDRKEKKKYERPLGLEEERRYGNSWFQTFLRPAILPVFKFHNLSMSLLVN